jgi:DNA-binding NarL/FixJ family response regulator
MATEIHGTFAAAGRKISTLVIANRHEIAGAGIKALLQASGHNIVACCSREDDLLRSAKAYRPDIIILAENIVSQEAAKTVLQLRACNGSVAIIFLLEDRDAITAADLLDLNVEGILLSAACARSVIDCVESVCHGRKWIDPNLLRHLAMAERPSRIASVPRVASVLTSREGEIAYLISRGLRNKEIARELHLSEGTVKMYLHRIYEKLRLGGRTQLALSTAGACARLPVSGNEAGSQRSWAVRIPTLRQRPSLGTTWLSASAPTRHSPQGDNGPAALRAQALGVNRYIHRSLSNGHYPKLRAFRERKCFWVISYKRRVERLNDDRSQMALNYYKNTGRG